MQIEEALQSAVVCSCHCVLSSTTRGSVVIRAEVLVRSRCKTRQKTSITIDDVTHVIDSCHVKETRFSPQSSTSVLPGACVKSLYVSFSFHP